MLQKEGPGTQDLEAQKQRLAALVREYGAAKIEREPSNTVLVWPNLLVIEFLAAAVMTLALVILSTLMNSPLEQHSNPNLTPNPSKAPWYFLNLQELLLHMDPSLAGVIVPGVAILALMSIPYVDNVVGDTGVWFSTPTGKRVALIAAVYTVIWIPVLIAFDNFVSVRVLVESSAFIASIGATRIIAEFLIPIAVMLGLPALLIYLIRPLKPSRRDIVIALFTGFIITYLLLTISGTGFRGEGMKLNWPWQIGAPVE